MSLTTYKKKRSFAKTTEPRGGKPGTAKHQFVVQLHDASHLHYDFRLEIDGVLKSWAVPKGPSMDPSIKRLAIEVEDHPFNYRSFEGTIPKGNYGGGTVMVWDRGTFTSTVAATSKKSEDNELLREWKAGKIKFELNGEKLKGEFALVKSSLRGDKSWFLMKIRDTFSTTEDVLLMDRSVVSGRSLEEIGGGLPDERSGRKAPSERKSTTKKTRQPQASTKATHNGAEETQLVKIDGHELKLTHLDKVYWPEEKITKRDMLAYYHQVAPYILPYLLGRPHSLNRFPDGIDGKSFYQKDVTGKVPDWADTFLYHSNDEEKAINKHFLVPRDESALMLMASMGCIEMNPWSSTVDHPDNPDWCLIDLDPGKNTFDEVITAAHETKKILDQVGVKGYCKTSGATGMHIYIPIGGKYTYDESKEFAHAIVTLVHENILSFTSLERMPAKRKGKMYLDFLQNRPQATLAAPYSLRPMPGAPVSMPLHWDEVKKGLKQTDFNIFNALERLKSEGDIFAGVLGKGEDLSRFIKK